MGGYDNYINNKPTFQPMQVGQNVQTSYGVGKITNVFYKNVGNGNFDLYATILVPGVTVYDQRYNQIIFTEGIGGQQTIPFTNNEIL